jgi:transposase
MVATLGYSRASYVSFGYREDTTALCTGLREAFDYFGGVPVHVLFDNTKAVGDQKLTALRIRRL